jgi:hypothetical protein
MHLMLIDVFDATFCTCPPLFRTSPWSIPLNTFTNQLSIIKTLTQQKLTLFLLLGYPNPDDAKHSQPKLWTLLAIDSTSPFQDWWACFSTQLNLDLIEVLLSLIFKLLQWVDEFFQCWEVPLHIWQIFLRMFDALTLGLPE